ncbi:MAG: class I SAM-dependent methyltransferase [Nocardioidaceae bacterium]|nr:class I SAM-dependent methyltransferase [Nocardioidaceae bacterium]
MGSDQVRRRTPHAVTSIWAIDRPVAVDVAGPGPRRVLDVGGGDGLDSLALAEDGHDVTVLDPSEPMLAAAAAEASSRGVPVRTVHGGLEDLHGLGQYDVVLCHFVLQYRPHDAADFATLAAAVRPGGLSPSCCRTRRAACWPRWSVKAPWRRWRSPAATSATP